MYPISLDGLCSFDLFHDPFLSLCKKLYSTEPGRIFSQTSQNFFAEAMCLSPSAWTLVLKALFPVKLFFWNSLRLCNILIKFHNESQNYLIYSQLIFIHASYQGNSFLCQGSVSMAFLHVLWCSWCKWKCSGVKFSFVQQN